MFNKRGIFGKNYLTDQTTRLKEPRFTGIVYFVGGCFFKIENQNQKS